MAETEQTAVFRGVRAPRPRTLLITAIALGLGWLVVSTSLAAYLATTAPHLALRLDSSQPTALLNLADRALKDLRKTPSPATDPAGEEPKPDGADAFAKSPGAEELFAALSRVATRARKESSREGQAVDLGKPEETGERLDTLTRGAPPLDAVRDLAVSALRADPLSGRALRILGEVASGSGDDARAEELFRAARARSMRETIAIYWLLRKSHERGDTAGLLDHADILLRTRPRFANFVVPVIAYKIEKRNAGEDLARMLAANPPWRERFLRELATTAADLRTELNIMLGLKTSPFPPTPVELRDYLGALTKKQEFELAYYTWLQFLPPDQLASAGLLFNGGFEMPFSDLPFDWRTPDGRGAQVTRERHPDEAGQHALLVELSDGRVTFKPATQMTLLGPGRYVLTAHHKGQLTGRRGLVWRVACAENNLLLAESDMIVGLLRSWTETTVSFTVPDSGCKGQTVRLDLAARSASEQLVSGRIWIDDVAIKREPS